MLISIRLKSLLPPLRFYSSVAPRNLVSGGALDLKREKEVKPVPRFFGRVIASYGAICRVQGLNVERPDLRRRKEDDVLCTIKGKAEKIRPYVGDYVVWERTRFHEDGHAQIMEILPRKNLFQRIEENGAGKPLAANIDQTVIVIAPEPQFTTLTIDRFLVGAHGCDSSPAIVFNKADLPQLKDQVLDLSQFYKSLGYPVVVTSVNTSEGLDELASILGRVSTSNSRPPAVSDKTILEGPVASQFLSQPPTSVFIGQSGTGKSSLLNALIPGLDLQVRELSEKLGRGKHTTTAATLHEVPSGGLIIDSPGFDNFFPVPSGRILVDECFPEFKILKAKCRFSDCMHRAEPDCAVKSALESGHIRPSRHESYLRIIGTMDQISKLPRLTRPPRYERLRYIKRNKELFDGKGETADMLDHEQDVTMKEYHEDLTGKRLKKFNKAKVPFQEMFKKMSARGKK